MGSVSQKASTYAATGASAAAAALSVADLLSLYSAASLDQFITRLHRAFSRIVPTSYVSCFYRRADGGAGFLEERDTRGRVWRGRFMRRYAELTPALSIVSNNRGIKLLTTKEALAVPEEELRKSPLYREIMRRQGWRHGAALCFWSDPPAAFPTFVLTFYRGAEQPDFSGEELRCLQEVHPYLAPAVSRFHDTSVLHSVTDSMVMALGRVSAGIVVLDWQLRVIRSTAAARRACALWTGDPQPSPRVADDDLVVPPALLVICQSLRQATSAAIRRAVRSRPPRLQTTVLSKSGLAAWVSAVCGVLELSEPAFVIQFERRPRRGQTPSTANPLEKLTECEREVALIVANGCSNQEAAEELGKTVHAVKFLLHRAYQKLGVSSRVQLSLLLRRGAPAALLKTPRRPVPGNGLTRTSVGRRHEPEQH